MSLSFDTCVLIDILRGRRPDFRERLRLLLVAETPLHLCAFAFHELMYGVEVSARPEFQRERAIEVCGFFKTADWTVEDAWATARLRAELKARGQTIGAIDALIAGQALARGWTLVTSNVGEFSRVEGLQIQDWSQP
jgi:tRNA(fMet)-specific endonuclease VapC